jgi:hypothetical protein
VEVDHLLQEVGVAEVAVPPQLRAQQLPGSRARAVQLRDRVLRGAALTFWYLPCHPRLLPHLAYFRTPACMQDMPRQLYSLPMRR